MNYEKALTFLKNRSVCFLATCDEGQPRVRPMSYYLKADDRLWMATYKDSRKVSQIEKNCKVEICFADDEYQHIRVEAEGEVRTDKASREKLWEASETLHNYFESVNDPKFAILDLEIYSIEVMMVDDMSYTKVEPA